MKKQIFYVFDEHTDFINECMKKGMIPCGNPFRHGFMYGDTRYVVLSPHDCYSGWELTVMALPCLDYENLIIVLESSKVYAEIVGCIGILLKKHEKEFTDYISTLRTKRGKKIKKIILDELVERSLYVKKMTRLIEVCKS